EKGSRGFGFRLEGERLLHGKVEGVRLGREYRADGLVIGKAEQLLGGGPGSRLGEGFSKIQCWPGLLDRFGLVLEAEKFLGFEFRFGIQISERCGRWNSCSLRSLFQIEGAPEI